MLKQNTLFSGIYAIDTATHYYRIEVGLGHYLHHYLDHPADLFNE